jgi:MSHA biogenesis protein MshQ
MSGSDLFVSKPYGLCLQTDSTCTVAGVNNTCGVFPGARAGDSFPLRIQAVGWQADGESLTADALCSGHIITPNFQMTGITLASALVAPVPGDNGTLSPTQYSHVLGNQTTTSTSISEVGVFQLSATPTANGYFGETVSGGQSALVGRFIPAYLRGQATASLTTHCGTSFSYQGQPMAFAIGQEPTLTVSGFNRSASITHNYDRGAFWRLVTPVADAYTSITGKTSLDLSGRLTQSGGASLAQSGANDGDGNSCSAYSYDFSNSPGSEVRLGHLRLGNAHGSELQALDLPLRIETWQSLMGGSFQVEGLDTCTTAAVLQTPALSSYTGQLSQQIYGNDKVTLIAPRAGLGLLRLQPPGINGSVLGGLPATPPWLFYDWNGTGREAATGLARFGIYRGSSPMIFRHEVYR